MGQKLCKAGPGSSSNRVDRALQLTLIDENNNFVSSFDTSQFYNPESVEAKIKQAETVDEFVECFDDVFTVSGRRIQAFYETFHHVREDAMFSDKNRDEVAAHRAMVMAAAEYAAKQITEDHEGNAVPNLGRTLMQDAALLALLAERIMDKLEENAGDTRIVSACSPNVSVANLKNMFGVRRAKNLLHTAIPLLRAYNVFHLRRNWYSDALHPKKVLNDEYLCNTNDDGKDSVPKNCDKMSLFFRFVEPERYTEEEHFWLFDPLPVEPVTMLHQEDLTQQ